MTLVRYRFYSSTLVSSTYRLGSLPFLLLHSRFGHVSTRFVTLFTPPLSFRARMTSVRYPFYSSALISGTYDLGSLPFLLLHSRFGHVSTRFVTLFTPPLSFRARIDSIRYRFYSSSLVSGTYDLGSLPFLLLLSCFGHV